MKTLLLASAALVTASPAPPPERPAAPCPKAEAKGVGKAKAEPRLLQSDRPNAAQRVIPGLF